MDWADTGEQATFRREVRDFIETRLPKYYQRKRERPETGLEQDWAQDFLLGDAEAKAAAREWLSALNEHGWGGPHWPQEYGGAGLTPREQFIFNQEIAEAQAPTIGGGNFNMLASTLLVHGTPEQRAKFLPPMLRGDIIWAQGFSEPGAGSDLASLQCRATRDGDDWVINGQKLWTSNAHKANWIFGMFRTDPDAPKHRGISFLIMDMKTPGISVRPIITMGWEHATNETFYEDVRIPAENIVGEPNRGWYVGATLLDFERSNIGGAVSAHRQLQNLIDYLLTPQGQLQGQDRIALNRDKVADRWIESEVMFNFSFRIISIQASGGLPNYEASTAKIAGSELRQRSANTGMKVFGLYANLWNTDEPRAPMHAQFSQQYVHSVVGSIGGGSNEIQRNIIATRGLGLPRS